MIDVPLSRLVGEMLDPERIEVEVVGRDDDGIFVLPETGPVTTGDVAPDD